MRLLTTTPRLAMILGVLLGLIGLPAVAGAQGLGAPTVPGSLLRGESADYATQTFGDPWDYDNALDVHLDEGPVINATAIGLTDGRLEVTFDRTGHFHQVWGGWPGGLRIGRDGPANPIDASRFTRMSFHVHSPVQTVGAVSYQTCPDVDAGCTGSVPFVLSGDGWDVITLDMTQGEGNPWTGPIQAIAITIGGSDTRTFAFDWMRLHEPGEVVDVSWTNPALTGESELRWDADDDAGNNTADQPGWGVLGTTSALGDSAPFDLGAFPPGRYRFQAVNGSARSAWSAPLVIEAAPRIVIDNPDITGGEDYATAVLGDPWDFSDPGDVTEILNVTDIAFDGGVLHGTNSGPDHGNPFIVLPDTGDLRADRYHRFSITTSFEGEFSLDVVAGGGMHGRISWLQDDGTELHQTAEVVTYSDRTTYTVPLGDAGPVELMEEDLGPQPGWNSGSATRGLRWDVNEDLGARRWSIDEIRLAADDESFGAVDVEWHDEAHQPGTTVTFHADTDRQGFSGTVIAADLAQVAGANAVRWDTTGLAPGEYWVWAEATSPGGVATTRTYATGPLQVRTPDPSKVPEPAGLRLFGPGRVETAVALAREAFPAGSDTALLATAGSFPDALAAAPLAAALDAPVLLTGSGTLHAATAEELRRLGVQRVVLLGGTAALSQTVADQVAAIVPVVVRSAGPDRFATAAATARMAMDAWAERGMDVGDPLVALGSTFTDALAAASLAGHARRPLLLTSHDRLPTATAELLAELDAGSATLVGGSGVVTDALLSALDEQVGTVRRLAGADHVETAQLVAREAVAAGARRDVVVVASGDAFPDALAAGPAVIAMGGVLLLTPAAHAGGPTVDFIAEAPLSRLHVAGGSAAVSSAAVTALADAAR